jgi:hypothetical protein
LANFCVNEEKGKIILQLLLGSFTYPIDHTRKKSVLHEYWEKQRQEFMMKAMEKETRKLEEDLFANPNLEKYSALH